MSKSIQDALLNFKPQKVESMGVISESGEYTARLIQWKQLDSFTDWRTGEQKDPEKLPPFIDPAPEAGLLFATDAGTALMRAHVLGYVQWEDLTEEAQQSGKYHLKEFHNRNYACQEDKKGNFNRVISKKRTADAENFLNQLLTAAGQAEAENLPAALDAMLEEKVEFNIIVKMETYGEGDPQPKITGFRRKRDVVRDEFGG